MNQGDVALRITRLSKSFMATQALDEVSFAVAGGTVHALLGGNGSGKSTLIKILAGVYRADPGGTVEVGGATYDAATLTPLIARDVGLRFVHQDLGLFPGLSIAENLAHGRGFERGRFKRLSWGNQRAHAAGLLERYGIDADPRVPVDTLGPAQQTMVAVARALQDDADTSILVLDEPTAALPGDESEMLLSAVRQYAAVGQTIVLVSHRIDEVLSVADAVTVLRDGRHVITRETQGLTAEAVVQHIVGRKLDRFYPIAGAPAQDGAPVCRVNQLSGDSVRDVSFEVGRGEIVGLAGLLGSGRTALLRMLFGAEPCASGTFAIDGTPVVFKSPTEAIGAGVAYVPEDRAAGAAFMTMSVRENLTIPYLERYGVYGRIDSRRERASARQLITQFMVRASSEQQELAALSGGNQQKVIVGRWLNGLPRLLLLDEPTQGVDIGARADLYKIMRAAVDQGAAAVVVSSDFDELANLADRVLVLVRGRVRAELQAPIDAHRLTELAHQH